MFTATTGDWLNVGPSEAARLSNLRSGQLEDMLLEAKRKPQMQGQMKSAKMTLERQFPLRKADDDGSIVKMKRKTGRMVIREVLQMYALIQIMSFEFEQQNFLSYLGSDARQFGHIRIALYWSFRMTIGSLFNELIWNGTNIKSRDTCEMSICSNLGRCLAFVLWHS